MGVPRTLIISTSWSIPDSPGNSGCPSMSSAITHPVDHTSGSPYVSTFINASVRSKGSWVLTNLSRIICGSENQLWSTIIARADVRYVRLVLDQDLGTAKVTKLQHPGIGVKQEILGFDVPVTDSLRMNVCQRAEQLIDIDLNLQDWHGCLHLVEEPRGSIHSFGNKFED